MQTFLQNSKQLVTVMVAIICGFYNCGVGGGPFVVQSDDADDEFGTLHWATRIDSMQALVVFEKQHESNKTVALSLKNGLKHCRSKSRNGSL